MADYIDREAAKVFFMNMDAGRRCPCSTLLTPEEFTEYLDEIPTADVAPVVRCRECKYWGDEAGVTVRADGVRFARCKVHNLHAGGKKIGWCPTEDDFCSLGKRGESSD